MTQARKRTRSSAKAAGSAFEKTVADYLAEHVDDRIERRVTNGANDRGDIAGLRAHGQRLVVECKNRRDWQPGTWLREAERERLNDAALATFVVAKRHGSADPGAQVVLMTMRDLVALLTGERPEVGLVTWFKVDDSFYSHPKVLTTSPGALGLWVVAGTWSAANLTDGFVSVQVLPRLLPDSVELAEELVTVGLWRRAKGGYQFHDWHKYQPTRESVLEARQKWAEKKAKQRAARAFDDEGMSPGDSPGESEGESPGESQGSRSRSRSPKGLETSEADKPPRDDVERLCKHLADQVAANGSKRPDVTKKWRDAARLLIDKDGRTEEQVRKAIDWCQGDEFWRENVMSMPKLREQFDRLRLAAQRKAGHGVRSEPRSTAPDLIPDDEKCEHRRRASTCGLCKAERIGATR